MANFSATIISTVAVLLFIYTVCIVDGSGPPTVCPTFTEGDQSGGSYDHIGMEWSDKRCIEECRQRMQSDNSINGVTIYDASDGVHCHCNKQMSGTTDETNYRSCIFYICEQRCQHGGTCVGPNQCSCTSGWTGSNCETYTCEKECKHGGTCIGPNRCRCTPGWTGKKSFCSKNVNECNKNKGGCDHICEDTEGSFKCKCKTAYTLDTNGRKCNEKRFTVVVRVPEKWKRKGRQHNLKIEL